MSPSLDNCPACNVSLIGDPIPQEWLADYSGTHWRREIGIEDPAIYDGVSWWRCPDCSFTWSAFPFSASTKAPK